ncbi:hypothetical protein L6164_022769 [Bauhinia variegata]|uniref:Uncharacterized protein n=1 Tax=Bauhinia variegata TaxID=167791 RepID=A0ACB9MI31_BAUVA|nr:hypothetical protein L6164_022769 [Bauhinia variegata]
MKIIIKLFAFAIVLLLLFFSTGDRVSATNVCVKPLPIAAGKCSDENCKNLCVQSFGETAHGTCSGNQYCVCFYACEPPPTTIPSMTSDQAPSTEIQKH